MHIESDEDFTQLRNKFAAWRKQFPMFKHDVTQIEKIIDTHIQNYSIIMVQHRQTRSRSYLDKAQLEIDAINTMIKTVEKIELMALLSRG